MQRRRVLVTGVGAISALGESLGALLSDGRSVPGAAHRLPCETFELSRYVSSVKSYIDRTSALALAAVKQALVDAKLLDGHARCEREVGLVYATQWGCMESMELFFAKLKGGNPRFAPPLPFSHSYANSPASVVSIEFGLRGHHAVFSTGRTSGAWAILEASDAIEGGKADVIACAASDALSRAVFDYYSACGRIPPEGAGPGPEQFALGEGSACLVLEAEGSARERAVAPKARILGVAASPAASPVDAMVEAARGAILRAGLFPGDVRRAIGTAAHLSGRQAELEALRLALELSPEEVGKIFTSLGAPLGETMGASAVMAAAAACSRDKPALILCAEFDPSGSSSSALAVLVGDAEG